MPTNHQHTGEAYWFYGRSGAGKTTLASRIAHTLKAEGYPVFLLDGDVLRSGLCRDLGFDEASRTENHRRAAEIAKLLIQQGFLVIGATMCPQQSHRSLLREVLGDQLCFVYLDATRETCSSRDPKGLYRRFKAGEIAHFDENGFQAPLDTERELTVHTGESSLADCIAITESFIRSRMKLQTRQA